MGNILDALNPKKDQAKIEWNSVEEDMRFYCSYCMLTGTNPKMVVSERTSLSSDDMSSMFLENDLCDKMSVIGVPHCANYDIVMYANINPYKLVDTFADAIQSAGSRVDVDIESITILETVNYITIKIGIGEQSCMSIRVLLSSR